MTDSVILFHGILRSSRSMRSLTRRLQAEGFRVLNLDYPSRRFDLAGLADWVRKPIESFLAGQAGRVHFVGHSMGGLLIRYYLHAYPLATLGRIVMLGTPNRGSEVADLLQRFPPYRWLYGLAGQQLCTHAAHVPLAGGEIGVVAGNFSVDPFCSWIIGAESDGKVSVESTRPHETHSHVVARASHSFMPSNKAVQKLVCRFLKTGKFDAT